MSGAMNLRGTANTPTPTSKRSARNCARRAGKGLSKFAIGTAATKSSSCPAATRSPDSRPSRPSRERSASSTSSARWTWVKWPSWTESFISRAAADRTSDDRGEILGERVNRDEKNSTSANCPVCAAIAEAFFDGRESDYRLDPVRGVLSRDGAGAGREAANRSPQQARG